MTNKRLTIGQVANLTSLPAKTIRYYEAAGILPPPGRSESRYRLYSETDVRRLELVRRARLLDMSLPEVKGLVEWASSNTCNDFQGQFLEVVRRKLEDVDGRMAELQRLKQDLLHLEAHFKDAGKEEEAGHTMLECSPGTCRCLGDTNSDQVHGQEMTLWLDRPGSKK